MNLLIKLFIFGAGVTILSATGCGFVSKGLSSDQDLVVRAAGGTGIPISDLSLVPNSVSAEFDTVHFQVRDTNGSIYLCTFSTMVLSTSQTSCRVIEDHTPAPTPAKKRSSSRKRSSSSGSSSSSSSPTVNEGTDDFELEGAGHS